MIIDNRSMIDQPSRRSFKMSGFLSANAMTSKSNNRRPYTLSEDQVICNGLEAGDSASTIVESLTEVGHERTVLSVRYRITTLRDAAGKYESLEDFHTKKAVKVVEAPVVNNEDEVDVEDELEELVAEA